MLVSPPASGDANVRSMERPLAGAVLCCTSIAPEDRIQLAEYAEQMGAEHKLDLTSDVTHLLVGATDTPKYRYVAKEREDVKVLRPEWVEAVRECWMEDRPLDMNVLEAEYRVPTLAGLKICITGFDDLTFRAQLQKNVVSNGGEYSGDLTKDVTHLIAAKPEGKKYEYATLWQKKVVSLQWYKDTLDRGMQLDESSYHPSRPAEEQGLGAWNREERGQPVIGKRVREEKPTQEPTRKLRRTASAKVGSQTDNMWGDIVGRPSYQIKEDQDILRSAKSMSALRNDKEPLGQEIHGSKRQLGTGNADYQRGFLSGLAFAIMKFDTRKEALVLRTLQGVGAGIVESLDELCQADASHSDTRYLIVPHQTREHELPQFPRSSYKLVVVTELWLERCMLQKAFMPLQQYPLGGIVTEIAASAVAHLTINATGFQSIETLHIAKTVALTGAKYDEVFTPKSSVLVCSSVNINRQKVFHANEWKIPAVSEGWLCRLLTDGAVPSFKDYLIGGSEEESDDLESELRQKRHERNPQESRDDEKDDKTNPKATLRSTNTTSGSSAGNVNDRMLEDEQHNPKGNRGCGLAQDRSSSKAGSETRDAALQEISPNSPSKRNRAPASPVKKSLFRTYDGASLMLENSNLLSAQPSSELEKTSSPKKSVQDATSINSAIQDLLNMKVKSKANATTNLTDGGGRKKRLLSRALSNLSNASHGSRQSRASSIDSLNTDGLGSEIAPPSGRSAAGDGVILSKRNLSFQGRAQSKPSSAAPPESLYQTAPIDISDPHLLRDEFEAPDEDPQLTQLGYEDSEEAVALREKLAAQRRATSRLGQKDGDPKPEVSGKDREALKQRQRHKHVIKDDDVLQATSWGGGRRTRAKNRSADMKDFEMF